MSDKKDETIKDIVREMRDNSDRGCDLSSPRHTQEAYVYIGRLADRIEAADNNACEQCKMLADAYKGIAELKEENARLKAALKPVLECGVIDLRDYSGMIDAFFAVREAKRIYNDSNNGESHN